MAPLRCLPAAGEVPGPDQPVEQVDLALDEVKTWSSPDGSAEYVALVFESNDTATVRLLRISGEGHIEEQTLLPPSDERGLRVFLLANEQSCYVQVRNGYGAEQRFGEFSLTPEGIQRTAGDLGLPSPEEGPNP